MENRIARAKEYYQSICRVWCPVLNDYITFNSMGFRHLMRSGRHKRSNADMIRRFRLLGLAVEMIENLDAEIISPPDVASSATKLSIIKETQDKIVTTVVIRQVGNGNKHFFSIYN